MAPSLLALGRAGLTKGTMTSNCSSVREKAATPSAFTLFLHDSVPSMYSSDAFYAAAPALKLRVSESEQVCLWAL